MSERLHHTLVLDTHVWYWIHKGDERMEGSAAVSAIEYARLRGGVIVSAISVWEIAMLEAKSRILLSQDCALWVRNALSMRGVILHPITPEIAVESTRLPGGFHQDPADRMIVATARSLGAPLVTADRQILAYGERKLVRTFPV